MTAAAISQKKGPSSRSKYPEKCVKMMLYICLRKEKISDRMAQKIYPEKLQNLYKLSILGSSMGKLWEVTAETRAIPKLQDPILIEGLPGIGNVGKIAVDFMVGELKAKRLYSFFSYRFPHSVFVNSKNLVDMPRLEIYYKRLGKGNKKLDLLFLVGDIQPIDEESCYEFCDEVLKIAL